MGAGGAPAPLLEGFFFFFEEELTFFTSAAKAPAEYGAAHAEPLKEPLCGVEAPGDDAATPAAPLDPLRAPASCFPLPLDCDDFDDSVSGFFDESPPPSGFKPVLLVLEDEVLLSSPVDDEAPRSEAEPADF